MFSLKKEWFFPKEKFILNTTLKYSEWNFLKYTSIQHKDGPTSIQEFIIR